MSKQSVTEEITQYIESSGFNAGDWSVDEMAEELHGMGIESIEDMDSDDFTDFLEDWDGKVTDYRGCKVSFEAAMNLADRDLLDELNDETWSSNQEYFDAYAVAHAKKYDGEKFAPYYGLDW